MPAVVISSEGVKGSEVFDDGAVGLIEKPSLGEPISSFEKRLRENSFKPYFPA